MRHEGGGQGPRRPSVLTRWVAAALAVALVGAMPSLAGAAEERSGVITRPDIVVVMLDDATTRQIAMLSTISSLAASGTTFSNMIVASPECCPSRATFLTGQYVHNHGVRSGIAPTGGYNRLDHTNALPVWLRAAGYHTIHVGKYMNGIGVSDPRQRPPGWSRYAGLIDPSTYDYWRFKVNHDGVIEQRGTAEQDYQTDVLTRMAVEDIATAPASQPLFLHFAPLAPHAGTVDGTGNRYPVPAPRHRRTSNAQPPSGPSVNEADVSDKPAHIRARPPLTATNLANMGSWYRQSIEALLSVDEGLAQIRSALQAANRLHRTVFLVTSDNGYLHGEHRITLAKLWPYEPSIKVPMIMAGPGVPSGVVQSRMASGVDLAPTIVDLADAEPHVRRTPDGLSLMRMLADPNLGANRSALVELGAAGTRQTYKAVRGPRWKYVAHSTGEVEMYDLVTDPHELQNRASDPSVASTRAALASRLSRLSTCRGSACTTIV